MEGVFGAPFVDVLRTCPVLAVTGVVCVLIGVLEGVVVSVGVGSTVGASEHSRALCLLVAGSECVLFILLGACNIVVGYVKALPTLLSRRSKPISSKLFGCCTLFCVVGITLASVDVSSSSRVQRGFCGEFSRTTLVFATSLIVISAFDLAMFLVIYLVDLEIHKPMDWDYDSIILHYARCLCWSSRKRRFVFGALPFYLLTLLSLILTLSYWNNGSGEPVCVYERRTYLMVASSLFCTYAVLVTYGMFSSSSIGRPKRVFCCSGKRYTQVLLVYMVVTSIGWGTIGGVLLSSSTTQCITDKPVWHAARGIHILLVLFGAILFFVSFTCNTEAVLMDYYTYFALPEHNDMGSLNQLMTASPGTRTTLGESFAMYTDTEESDVDSSHEQSCDIVLS